jgi:8-oxo-dGTP pyrophosphatase MutT (NUDIX family)
VGGPVQWEAVPRSVLRAGYRLAYVVLSVVWWLRRRAPGGVKCVILRGEDVLLVRHTYGPKRWELPGGARHRREEPAAAARREMREELGADLPDWEALEPIEIRLGRAEVTLRPFLAQVEQLEPRRDDVEIAEARFFRLGALPAPLGRDVPRILDQVARHRSRDLGAAGSDRAEDPEMDS